MYIASIQYVYIGGLFFLSKYSNFHFRFYLIPLHHRSFDLFPFQIAFRIDTQKILFKSFPLCSKGSPSVLVNGPAGVIKCAQSLIAKEGSRQFSDRDRARASYLAR